MIYFCVSVWKLFPLSVIVATGIYSEILHVEGNIEYWTDQFGKLCLCFYCKVTQLCLTLCGMDCSMPGFSVLHYLAEFAQTHVHWISRAIQTPYPLLPSSSPALNIFQHQGLFQWVSLHIRWLKYWSFSFNISLSNKYSGLISFRVDWFELLATRGTLKNLFQHHSSKASILRYSTFFSVQLSHLYMTTGKTITLTIQPFSVKWCLWF